LADIGKCERPIRLRRTLAANTYLAASLLSTRLSTISAKRFFAGKAYWERQGKAALGV
jgi:hypothetical protein